MDAARSLGLLRELNDLQRLASGVAPRLALAARLALAGGAALGLALALALAFGPGLALARCQQGAAATRAAAPARIFRLEFARQWRVDDEAVVIVQLLADADIAQCVDEHAPLVLIGLAIGFARMIDPARGVATDVAIDHVLVVDVKIKRVIGLRRIVRVATQGLFPTDDLADIFHQALAFGNVADRENAFAVDARAAHLQPAPGGARSHVGWLRFSDFRGHRQSLIV